MIRSIFFLLFCCFFAGCSMIPEYQRPEGSTSDFWLSGENVDINIDNFLNVLDAQRSLFDAQQGEIEIEKRSLSNQVSLYKVLGGGISNEN